MRDVKTWLATGLRHRSRGLACQDWACTRESGSVCAIALADGTGTSDLGALGAQTAAESVAELLCAHYDALYSMEDKQLQYTCLMAIRQALYAQCRQWQAEIGELGSTCLALARDEASGTWLALHLGDGYVAARTEESLRILSGPENGINRDYTVLTTSNPAAPHMRILRGLTRETEGFCLLSDGWGKEVAELQIMLRTVAQTLEEQTAPFIHSDDLGAVSLGNFTPGKEKAKRRSVSRA